MHPHEMIFSDQRRYRVTRHILFWSGWLIFASAVQLTGLSTFINLSWNNRILYQLIRSINRFPPQILFCYVTVYFLVPRLIPKRKYLPFAFSILLLFVLTMVFTYSWFSFTGGIMQQMIRGHTFDRFTKSFYSFYSNVNFTGALPVTCLMLIAKSYKAWYRKQIKSEILQRENIHAELQLLKAQVHPHFLFNTLNNIYSFAYSGSPVAADLVDKLSGIMNYMSTEGAKLLVPLEKEILLMHDYLGLEKVRYGERLKMRVEISGNPNNKMIAPLLMIPFVENCFKHGASAMRGKQWIELNIQVTDDELIFRLSNSKPSKPAGENGKKGIGLANVQKRLQLLYPGKHLLKMESEQDAFRVCLNVSLHEVPDSLMVEKKLKKKQSARYA